MLPNWLLQAFDFNFEAADAPELGNGAVRTMLQKCEPYMKQTVQYGPVRVGIQEIKSAS